MTTELNASQTERGAETGTNVGQPWEAKFMNLDRLLTPELEPLHSSYDHDFSPYDRNVLRDLIRPEVEALQEQLQAERNRADYERQARIDAANFPRNRHGYIPCQRCGIDCGMDAVIADDVWDTIAPIPEWPEAGMFCLWCMDELLVEAGVAGPIEVKVYFAGKVLQSAPYEEALQARVRELETALHRIGHGDQESYLSCPGAPICGRTHDEYCGVGIARATLEGKD